MVANDENNNVKRKGHGRVAWVVKAVKALYWFVTAYMTSTADARCPENLSKLRKIAGLLLRQRREFIIAADWNMVLEQLETTGFLRLVWELRDRAARRVRYVLQRSQH